MMRTGTGLAILALLIAGVALASTVHSQAAGQPKLLILHDVPDDGLAYVGSPYQFGYLVLTQDEKTTVHKNGKIVVEQNGVKLYETGGFSTAHDYDALNQLLFTFPVEGPYTVRAEVPFNSAIDLKAEFHGFAQKPSAIIAGAAGKLKVEGTPQADVPTKFTLEVDDAAGAVIPHSDALFEVRRADDNWLLFRTHAHSHESAQTLQYTFPDTGDYLVRAVFYQAYPEKGDAWFAPVTVTQAVHVESQGVPMQLADGAITPGKSKYVLLGTEDPAPPGPDYQPPALVGPFGNVRLNAIVYDPQTKALVPHVDFKATLSGPGGLVLFTSESLHEYDGVLEVVTQNQVPGDYSLLVEAKQGDWSSGITLPFRVIPPAVPTGTGAGPFLVKATGLDKIVSGRPTTINLSAQTVAGTAQQHSEIEIQINSGKAWEPPLLINKLHTHADGMFGVDVTFPVAGTYTLVLDPETLDGEPTPVYYYDAVGKPTVVTLDVKPGSPLPDVAPAAQTSNAAGSGEGKGFAPGPGPELVLVALAALVLGRRYA